MGSQGALPPRKKIIIPLLFKNTRRSLYSSADKNISSPFLATVPLSVLTHISEENPQEPKIIKTVRGLGYIVH